MAAGLWDARVGGDQLKGGESTVTLCQATTEQHPAVDYGQPETQSA